MTISKLNTLMTYSLMCQRRSFLQRKTPHFLKSFSLDLLTFMRKFYRDKVSCS